MFGKVKKLINHIWKKVVAVLLTLLIFVSFGLAWRPSAISAEDVGFTAYSAYNRGVALMREENFKEAQKEFSEALVLALEGSDVSVNAKYNLALAVLEQGGLSSEILFQVKAMFEEALRKRPQDTDIRKNLELLQAVLLQTLKAELAKAGGDPGEAEEMIDGFAPQYPGEGEKPGRTNGNERSY